MYKLAKKVTINSKVTNRLLSMLIALTMLISGINIMSIEANAEYGGDLTVTGGIISNRNQSYIK